MALASEGLIQRAYGAIDLSGFYGAIDSYAKQAAADAKAEKQALQKEYYTNEAIFNRKPDKIRERDAESINSLHNQWKSINQTLMANPHMINNNPKEYYRLKEKADNSYEEAMSAARESRLQQEDINKVRDSYLSNPKKFEDNTVSVLKDLDKYTTKEIKEKNLLNLDNILYKGVDISKFNTNLDASLSKGNIIIKDVDANIRPGAFKGIVISDKYNVINPTNTLSVIDNYVDSLPSREKQASSIMETAYKSGAVDRAFMELDRISDYDLAKFTDSDGRDIYPLHTSPNGTQTRKPIIPKPTGDSSADLKNYLMAQKFVEYFPRNATKTSVETATKGKTDVALQKSALGRQASLDNRKEYKIWSEKNYPTATSELTDISSGLFGLIAGGKAKEALGVLSKIPNGFTNSVYQFGSTDPAFAKGNEAMAFKLGIKPDALAKMSVEDISKKSGISVPELENGVITSTGSDGVSRVYDMVRGNGYNQFLTDNAATFGSKAKKGFLTNLSQELNSRFQQPNPEDKGKPATKPTAKPNQGFKTPVKPLK